ncbi:hypothetical protein F8388_000590, partial [Cannabis sativa]
ALSHAGRVTSCFLLSAAFQGEFVNVVIYFMSEQAIFFLETIGLLGEYCPSSRKKNRSLSKAVGCMHLGPFEEYSWCGCKCMQLFLFAEDQSIFVERFLKGNTSAAYSHSSLSLL